MAAIPNTPKVPLESYLARFVEGGEKPTCEYIDGELVPKPMPSKDHSRVQMNIGFSIRRDFAERFTVLPELTVRLRETRFLVPDLAVEDLSNPIEARYPGPRQPVFLCVEVKSPDDRLGRLFSKCEDYHAWGVPYTWVIDPERKIAWEYTPADAEPRRAEEALGAGPIRVGLADVFRGV